MMVDGLVETKENAKRVRTRRQHGAGYGTGDAPAGPQIGTRWEVGDRGAQSSTMRYRQLLSRRSRLVQR